MNITASRWVELKERFSLAWKIIFGTDGYLVDHAKVELSDHLSSSCPMNRELAGGLINVVRTFETNDYSGFISSYSITALKPLLAFKPLGALTGEPSEWMVIYNSVNEDNSLKTVMYQNRRCSHVFKEVTGDEVIQYDAEGVIFQESNGSCFTSAASRTAITFPYVPTRTYVDVPDNYTHDQLLELAAKARHHEVITTHAERDGQLILSH